MERSPPGLGAVCQEEGGGHSSLFLPAAAGERGRVWLSSGSTSSHSTPDNSDSEENYRQRRRLRITSYIRSVWKQKKIDLKAGIPPTNSSIEFVTLIFHRRGTHL